MQVQVMRERLDKVDATCCALTSQEEQLRAEVAEAMRRRDLAELELLRRSSEEFARLRDLQAQVQRLQEPLQSSGLARAAGSLPSKPAKQTRTRKAAIQVIESLLSSDARLLLKFCFTDWSREAHSRRLLASFLEHYGASDGFCSLQRFFAAWHVAAARRQLQGSSQRLLIAAWERQTDPLLRCSLQLWRAKVVEALEASQLGSTPMSHVVVHSTRGALGSPLGHESALMSPDDRLSMRSLDGALSPWVSHGTGQSCSWSGFAATRLGEALRP